MIALLTIPNVSPPNPPWRDLRVAEPSLGCLSIYLSDDLSPLPVRAITLPANNKSDPNLETATYGVFSTCSRQMRSSVVNRGLRYIFFVTRWNGVRVITGYYRVRWYAPGPLEGSPSDYCLAADRVRFVIPGLGIRDVPRSVRDIVVSKYRLFRHLDPHSTAVLVNLLDARADHSDQ